MMRSLRELHRQGQERQAATVPTSSLGLISGYPPLRERKKLGGWPVPVRWGLDDAIISDSFLERVDMVDVSR
jgi:hypothetical protein